MSWAERAGMIAVGDRVCFRRAFLQSTGQVTGEAPLLRGVVEHLRKLGETTLAEVRWDGEQETQRVHVANLARITERGIDDPP
jgi:hypothetical protein